MVRRGSFDGERMEIVAAPRRPAAGPVGGARQQFFAATGRVLARVLLLRRVHCWTPARLAIQFQSRSFFIAGFIVGAPRRRVLFRWTPS